MVKKYGTFIEKDGGDGVFYYGSKETDTDFYEMQRHDMHISEGVSKIFDSQFYWVTDDKGRVTNANADISRVIPNGTLWGGTFPDQKIVDDPHAYTFDGDKFAIFVPNDWKKTAHAKVRNARDELLNAITDPDETQTGKLAWNAKLISSVIVLLGLDKTKALFGGAELPSQAEVALGQITQSMTYLAEAQGVTLEQFAFKIVGKFFGFSAFVWLADEKTQQAWQAIDSLPDTAEGYAMLDDLEAQLSAEAQALVAQVKGLAAE